MVLDESARGCTQKDRTRAHLPFLNGDVYSDNLTHARKNCYSSSFQVSTSRGTGLVENTELLPRHVSLVVKGGGDGGGWRSFSPGFGQSLLQSPVLAKRTEATHTPLTQNTQRDNQKDALTVGSIHMQYNVSPSD